MAISKVTLNDDTLIDLTNDNATESDVANGKKFHLSSGVQGTGAAAFNIYTATYDATNYNDILAAYNEGKFIVVKRELNGTTFYLFTDLTSDGTFYFRSFSNNATTNYGCYINTAGTWAVNSYAYAMTSSPTFTGTPKAPTATAGTDTTQIATTAFVKTAVDNSKSSALSLTLVAGSWSSATPPTQSVTATGVTVSNNIIVGFGNGITSSQYDEMIAAKLVCTAQTTDNITITAYGDKPTGNIPISVVILG